MNKAAQIYWEAYWKEREKPQSVSAWQFGDNSDDLAQLVIEGKKTATCSAYMIYELEHEPLPTIGDYSIILNSAEEPVAIIKTTEVTLTPMNEVTEEFAFAEGEGDRSYRYWKEAHEEFFTDQLNKIGHKFSEDMLLVCERFELVDVKK
ncbi:ASCH domain-containing protein [Bacillus aquiflavi]|uniref:ASCH domain-containing protein n=1 Tax=Bacillus aquiflavi TaxID=2672567 RepID=A0A6B3VZ70_9BACI|nr:ASCH domain-containing protein [Bacillus aquiflavi]MBA4536685.1 ASCH domain-containing protein [Bacillus aquiflavi]NEY81053.1 ASCH domain-containing protein [Bacillus aquiflavi]UAC48721.1 ASCH domain-containing protein [Bacillus aquiflavi]